jgi:hypothetical protein
MRRLRGRKRPLQRLRPRPRPRLRPRARGIRIEFRDRICPVCCICCRLIFSSVEVFGAHSRETPPNPGLTRLSDDWCICGTQAPGAPASRRQETDDNLTGEERWTTLHARRSRSRDWTKCQSLDSH